MTLNSGNKTKSKKIIRIIALNVLLIILGLGGLVSGSLAWFITSQTATIEAGTFTVVAPDGLSYDLYYLDHFVDAEDASVKVADGNFNTVTSVFSGYDAQYAKSAFTKIVVENEAIVNDPNPTEISHLWPAHKLTFAIVITSSEMEKFTLDGWSETEKASSKTGADDYVHLSWAIDIYGGAYLVTKTNDVLADVATGFESYYADSAVTDAFINSQALEEAGESPVAPVDIIAANKVPALEEGKRVIAYFTIEFSNDEDTFYVLDKTTGFYAKNVLGNSNCYEGLQLTNLAFGIK